MIAQPQPVTLHEIFPMPRRLHKMTAALKEKSGNPPGDYPRLRGGYHARG